MEHRITPQVHITPKKVNGVSAFATKNAAIFIVVGCVICGLLAGTLFFKFKNTGGNYFEVDFFNFFAGLKGGYLRAFGNAMMRILPFAALIFLSGSSMVGMVLTPVITFAFGWQFGLICSYAYVHYSLNGIMFNLLMIIPSAVILSIGIILSARESIHFALCIARLTFPNKQEIILYDDFRLYCMRQLFVLLFYLAAGLLQTVLGCAFSGYFNFIG